MIRTFVYLVALTALLSCQVHAQTAGQTGGGSSTKPLVTVNLNTATVSELQGLPGIGPATAARILEYRQKNGPFKKIEELMNVRGVGEKTFLKLKSQLSVTAKPASQASVQD